MEATKFGWEFLTKVINLPEDRLYVTYFGGDEKMGLPADLEAKQMWMDLGVEEKRLIPGSVKDNFWGKLYCFDTRYVMTFNGVY